VSVASAREASSTETVVGADRLTAESGDGTLRPASAPPRLFGDLLAERVAARESQVVLGLDPDPARLWPEAIRHGDLQDPGTASPAIGSEGAGTASPAMGSEGAGTASPAMGSEGAGAASPAVRAARAVAVHCALVLDAVGEECVAVKLQVACFERLGAPGWRALADTVALAGRRGLLVIADAKRGDVDVTAAAYAQAFLGETPSPYGPIAGLGADALTVNPLLGRDALAPFVRTARDHGRGLFVLVRTSNPGAADLQELGVAGGERVSERLAAIVEDLGTAGIGRAGLSNIGAVVGATAPERLQALRERMPHAPFLLPGVGAQGGQVEDLAPAFACGPAGGLVSASRGIVAAHERVGGDPAACARREAHRLRDLAWRLSR
jgi:orotidine-5'-phosphate decarboxylase